MVERTALQVVILWVLGAGVDLECVQIEEHHALRLTDIPCIRPFYVWPSIFFLKRRLRTPAIRLTVKSRLMRHKPNIERHLLLQLLLLLQQSNLLRQSQAELLLLLASHIAREDHVLASHQLWIWPHVHLGMYS